MNITIHNCLRCPLKRQNGGETLKFLLNPTDIFFYPCQNIVTILKNNNVKYEKTLFFTRWTEDYRQIMDMHLCKC